MQYPVAGTYSVLCRLDEAAKLNTNPFVRKGQTIYVHWRRQGVLMVLMNTPPPGTYLLVLLFL